jgi:hypothetical protein
MPPEKLPDPLLPWPLTRSADNVDCLSFALVAVRYFFSS